MLPTHVNRRDQTSNAGQPPELEPSRKRRPGPPSQRLASAMVSAFSLSLPDVCAAPSAGGTRHPTNVHPSFQGARGREQDEAPPSRPCPIMCRPRTWRRIESVAGRHPARPRCPRAHRDRAASGAFYLNAHREIYRSPPLMLARQGKLMPTSRPCARLAGGQRQLEKVWAGTQPGWWSW